MLTHTTRRILTAIALITITAVMVSLGTATVLVTLCLIGIFIQYELASMLCPNNIKTYGCCMLFGQSLLGIWLICTKDLCWINSWMLLSGFAILATPHHWEIPREKKFYLLAALLLYTSRGLACLYWLYSSCIAWLTLVLLSTCSSDTLAYAVGRLAGRHRLCPTISKNKTWEGLWAGLCAAVIVPALTWLFAQYMTWPSWQHITAWDMLHVAIICALVAPIGDLCESKLKRIVQVKDASQILPGHGGVLDRVDGLLPCAMATWTWLCYVGKS